MNQPLDKREMSTFHEDVKSTMILLNRFTNDIPGLFEDLLRRVPKGREDGSERVYMHRLCQAMLRSSIIQAPVRYVVSLGIAMARDFDPQPMPWRSLIQEYSRRHLSVSSDKSAAFAGIPNAIGSWQRRAWSCSFGLASNYLARGVAWQAGVQPLRRINEGQGQSLLSLLLGCILTFDSALVELDGLGRHDRDAYGVVYPYRSHCI